MKTISIPVVIMVTIAIYTGLYHLFMYLMRREGRENLSFSILCFALASYDIFTVGLYNTNSIAEGMHYQKGQFVSLCAFMSSVLWFAYDFTKTKTKFFVRSVHFFSAFYLLMAFIIAFYSGRLTFSLDAPMPKRIRIFGWIDITYNEVEPGLLIRITMLVSLIVFVYILVVGVRYYRSRKGEVKPIIFAFIIFYLACLNDAMVNTGIYPFIYLIEYSFLLIILIMTYALLFKFVSLHREITALNVGLEKKVVERTRELSEARDALWGEMEIAKKIQTVLLPDNPHIDGYEISAYMAPASEVGGDYYDVINVEGTDWVVIGDVSGHGVPAGLIMMMVQTSIQTVINHNPRIPPSSLISIINKTIMNNINKLRESKFMSITVFAAYRDGSFVFSGLHLDIMLYRALTGDVEIIETNGMWLGLRNDIEGMVRNDTFTMYDGDTMLVYTDGITEAWRADSRRDSRSISEHMYGQERLQNVFRELGDRPTGEIREGILSSLKDYRCHDDATLLILKRNR